MRKTGTKSEDNWELKAVRLQLKQILKQKKLGYRALAERLGVAEITIKRFFVSEDISFSKLQQICRAIGISVIDLAAVVKEAHEQSFNLTTAQELFFSENERVYDFFVLLAKYKSVKQAVQKGRLQKENIPKFLRELEEFGLLEIPAGDAVHIKKSGVVTWLKGGPLQKKFMRQRHIKYLDSFESQIGKDLHFLTSSQRNLRPESIEEMKRDLEFIAHKYRARAYREEIIFAEEQLVGVAWLLGLGIYSQL